MTNKREFNKKIFQDIVEPILPHFKLKDLLQVIVGASILAVPIGFTEETWRLGESLPWINVSGLMILSLIFISMFTYHHYHHHKEGDRRKHREIFVTRVFATYALSFFVVALILTLIERAPWSTDLLVAFKRVAIVSFPSSLSATLTDTLK